MARPIRFAAVAGLAAFAAGGVAALVNQLRHIDQTGADLMAKFEGLDADITELKQQVADAARRVEDAVNKMTDDSADQTEVDQAQMEVRAAIGQLKAIAPDPGPPAEPVV
jgi:predicted  nucleic acid-binding Zn-ribbon protein